MTFDIKARLRERGLQQRQIAVKLGVSDATVSLWGAALREGRHQRVPAEKARSLAELLDVPPGIIRPDLWPAVSEAA